MGSSRAGTSDSARAAGRGDGRHRRRASASPRSRPQVWSTRTCSPTAGVAREPQTGFRVRQQQQSREGRRRQRARDGGAHGQAPQPPARPSSCTNHAGRHRQNLLPNASRALPQRAGARFVEPCEVLHDGRWRPGQVLAWRRLPSGRPRAGRSVHSGRGASQPVVRSPHWGSSSAGVGTGSTSGVPFAVPRAVGAPPRPVDVALPRLVGRGSRDPPSCSRRLGSPGTHRRSRSPDRGFRSWVSVTALSACRGPTPGLRNRRRSQPVNAPP